MAADGAARLLHPLPGTAAAAGARTGRIHSLIVIHQQR